RAPRPRRPGPRRRGLPGARSRRRRAVADVAESGRAERRRGGAPAGRGRRVSGPPGQSPQRSVCYIGPMASEPLHRISVEDYLALERRPETRNEYLNGEIFAMAGASRSHNRIVLNLGISLDGQLKNRGCEIFVNEMRVAVLAADLITYPDVVVSCGDPQF